MEDIQLIFDELVDRTFKAKTDYINGNLIRSTNSMHCIKNDANNLAKLLSFFRLTIPHGRTFKDATTKDAIKLQELNGKFLELQELTRYKVEKIEQVLRQKINDRDSSLTDYDVNVTVEFYIGESDPV